MNEILMALGGLLATFLVYVINQVKNRLKAKTKNETEEKYIKLLADAITDCVVATNQTFTDSLKKQNEFGEEKMAEAFQKTYENVMKILSKDAVKCLNEVYGDLETYITNKIEFDVREEKRKTNEDKV